MRTRSVRTISISTRSLVTSQRPIAKGAWVKSARAISKAPARPCAISLPISSGLIAEKMEAFGWLERGEPKPRSNTPRWVVNPRVQAASSSN